MAGQTQNKALNLKKHAEEGSPFLRSFIESCFVGCRQRWIDFAQVRVRCERLRTRISPGTVSARPSCSWGIESAELSALRPKEWTVGLANEELQQTKRRIEDVPAPFAVIDVRFAAELRGQVDRQVARAA